MRRRLIFLALVLSIIVSVESHAAAKHGTKVNWQPWSASAFEQAQREQKLVLLDLAAEWCHWCHVMDAKTYSNDVVADYIHANYIPVRVDHDANPALADRYREYGWPATVVLNAAGNDIVKRAGYIAPDNMLRLLRAIVADPSPERQARVAPAKSLNAAVVDEKLLATLRKRHIDTYDFKVGGLAGPQKFIDRNKLEYSLVMAARGNAQEQQMAEQTLDAALALIDPEWGGMYQYSTHYDWQHAHFEKIMQTQAGALRLYATGYLQMRKAEYLAAAESVAEYLREFVTAPDGRFYTSQDADLVAGEDSHDFFALADQQRRALGIPKVDKNIYARENGMAIAGLLQLYAAVQKPEYLQRARLALAQINISHRQIDGHYRHGAEQQGLFLNDNSEMLNALLLMYKVTAERPWLNQALLTADAILANLKHPEGGFYGTPPNPDFPAALRPRLKIDNNIDIARRLNLLFHYSGKQRFRAGAEHALKFLAHPQTALRRIEETGLLLLADEMAGKPAHYTVVAKSTDALAPQLYAVALRQPGWYQRTEWWQLDQGKLFNHDVAYPQFPQAAGYFCSDNLCSSPSFTIQRYQQALKAMPK